MTVPITELFSDEGWALYCGVLVGSSVVDHMAYANGIHVYPIGNVTRIIRGNEVTIHIEIQLYNKKHYLDVSMFDAHRFSINVVIPGATS